MSFLLVYLFSLFVLCSQAAPVRSMIGADNTNFIDEEHKPYDSEVEYLESTGTQYIVVPVTFSEGTIRIEGRVLSTADTTASTPIRWYLGSGASSISNNGIYLGLRFAQAYYDYVGNWANTQGSSASSLYEEGFVIEYNTENKEVYRKRRNGNTNIFFEQTANTEQWNKDVTLNIEHITLFGGRSDGNETYPSRIWWMKIFIDNQVVRDLICVQKDGIGMLYDKVNGDVFGNIGIGEFIIGSDKE